MTPAPAKLVRPAIRNVRNHIFDSALWDTFDVRPDDIIISTYPKCGTTWTQRIVGMLIFQSAAPFPVQDSSPWPDMRIFPPEMMELAKTQTHRRFLKSHLPYDALPVHEGVKFIHVARDGRDAAMSFHNHKMAMTPHVTQRVLELNAADPKFKDEIIPWPVTNDPAEHFRQWVDGPEDEQGDIGAGFFHIENSFWKARHEPNVLLVHYQDMKTDREGEMRRIADFLDIDIPESLWPELVEAAGFDAMKKKADELLPNAGMIFEGGGNTFLHKGTNGRWEGVVDPEDLARYEAKVAAQFSPALAEWVAKGRLATVDPRLAPD